MKKILFVMVLMFGISGLLMADTETPTETETITETQTITQTPTVTITATPSITATPTSTPTTIAYNMGAGSIVYLSQDKKAGVQQIFTGKGYVASYVSFSGGNTGNVYAYDVTSTATINDNDYRFIIQPPAGTGKIDFHANNGGTQRMIGLYFVNGLAISKTAANMEGLFLIFKP